MGALATLEGVLVEALGSVRPEVMEAVSTVGALLLEAALSHIRRAFDWASLVAIVEMMATMMVSIRRSL